MPAKTLSTKELSRALAVIATSRHAARNRIAVLLSFYAGLRACEIAALKISSALDDLGNVKTEIQLSRQMTKGNRARAVVVSSRLQKELAAYIATLNNASPNRPLICSQKQNRAFSANSLVQVFARIYSAAAIANASSHSGRRTFITRLASKGVSARVLQKLAGHASLNTTQKYIDTTPQMLRNAVELF
jgi:integrase/recombinase XerD